MKQLAIVGAAGLVVGFLLGFMLRMSGTGDVQQAVDLAVQTMTTEQAVQEAVDSLVAAEAMLTVPDTVVIRDTILVMQAQTDELLVDADSMLQAAVAAERETSQAVIADLLAKIEERDIVIYRHEHVMETMQTKIEALEQERDFWKAEAETRGLDVSFDTPFNVSAMLGWASVGFLAGWLAFR